MERSFFCQSWRKRARKANQVLGGGRALYAHRQLMAATGRQSKEVWNQSVKSDLLPQTCTPTYVGGPQLCWLYICGRARDSRQCSSNPDYLLYHCWSTYCITALAAKVIEVTTKGRFLGAFIVERTQWALNIGLFLKSVCSSWKGPDGCHAPSSGV